MKNKWMLVFIVGVFLASGGADEETELENVNSKGVDIEDLLENETLEELVLYETIEDYAAIKSKTELYDLFGEENIEDDVAWYAEGTVKLECSYLTNPDNGNYIKFLWDQENSDKLSGVEVSYHIYDEDYNPKGTQHIKSECGIYAGMSLVELEDWNGGPFEFSGFEWDYAGGVIAKEGSKIYNCDVKMELECTYNKNNHEQYTSLLGDVIFSSDSKEAEGAPIFVGTLSYYPQ